MVTWGDDAPPPIGLFCDTRQAPPEPLFADFRSDHRGAFTSAHTRVRRAAGCGGGVRNGSGRGLGGPRLGFSVGPLGWLPSGVECWRFGFQGFWVRFMGIDISFMADYCPAMELDSGTIGGRIRLARRAAGATQKAWSAFAGVDQGTLSEWERGKYAPRSDALARLVKGVGLCAVCILLGDHTHSTASVTAVGPEWVDPSIYRPLIR